MTKTIPDVICPFCGTLCDDLEVVVSDDGKQTLEVYNACVIGTEKFLHSQSKDRVTRPRLHQPDGTWKEISYDEAAEYTAQMLAKAKKPLMYGWSSTNCEAQSVGNEIAEITRACCDNTAAVCHGNNPYCRAGYRPPVMYTRGNQEPGRPNHFLGLQPGTRSPPAHVEILNLPPRILHRQGTDEPEDDCRRPPCH